MAMYSVGINDREPIIFRAFDIDWFESHKQDDKYRPPPLVLENCFGCHRDTGVLSMNSYGRSFSEMSHTNPKLEDLGFEREVAITKDWKQEQASWGMLQGYWEAAKN